MYRLDRVKELFEQALHLSDGTRALWITCECEGDGELEREVLRLLTAHAAMADATEVAGTRAPEVFDPPPQARFGAYQADTLIGRGGMGAVYLAHRTDGQFQQTVALKVMAAHLVGGEFLHRFERERQLLASLDHPNIPRLMDGGVSSSGDPFLVTEHVDGLQIDRFCDERRMGIANRLRIFLQLCEAVGYAHRNLIVHRDLKPGNILVNRQSAVKLLDFGTASLMGGQADATVTSVRMLTPRYASPEQLRGERVNTATDIFSLGVVLYELLTGAWPFGNPDSIVNEWSRAARQVEAAPPAAVVTQAAAGKRGLSQTELRRILKSDLALVVLKALEDRPADRYESVAQFAADIQNYLDGKPVLAHAPGALYRTGKYLRKYRLPAAAMLVLAAGLAAAGFVVVRQQHVAQAEALKAEKVNSFLNGMLASPSTYSFDPQRFTVAQMLEAAEPQLEQGWKNDPPAEATLRRSLGRSYTALRRYDRAEFHLRRARAIYESLGQEAEIVATLQELALAKVEEPPQEPIRLLDEALGRLRRLRKEAAPAVEFDIKSKLGVLLAAFLKQRLPEARALITEAMALGKRNPTIRQEDVAYMIAQLGSIQLDEGDFQEAEVSFRRALDAGRAKTPGGFWETIPLNGLMRLNARRLRLGAAIDFARQSYEISIRNLGPDHPATASSMLAWARYRSDNGEFSQAEVQVTEALPVVRHYKSGTINLLIGLSQAAHVMNQTGRFAEAQAFARESLAMADSDRLAETDWRRADTLVELGTALCAQKLEAEGRLDLERAEIAYRENGPGWTSIADAVPRFTPAARNRRQ